MMRGLGQLLRSSYMPVYFVQVLKWLFTLVMIFGGIFCGLLIAAPKLRKHAAFFGTLADNLRPFAAVLGLGTAICSFIRLFWSPGTPFVEDMLPGLLGTGAGIVVFLDWLKARQAGGGSFTPTLQEPVAMAAGLSASGICFLHMFVGWHAPVL